MADLFTPLDVGPYTLSNRLVMAPMTRSRADGDGVQSELAATYYAQRAGAGLIVTEGVFPSAMGKGYVNTPGIVTDEQVEAWRGVADAVHAEGGRIFMQIMHVGRISHPSMLPDGATPVAPSAVRADAKAWTRSGPRDLPTPRALTPDEIAEVVDDYRRATRRALEAGFDGVELHAASGYLPEQFLSSGTNRRTDAYGGSVDHRVRFVLEVLDAMADEAGAGRVGIKIAPEMGFNDIVDDDPVETYTHLVEQLRGRGLAYLHVTGSFDDGPDYHALLRERFDGPYFIGGGLDRTSARAHVESARADAAVFGAAFIANPDLPERFKEGVPLAEPDRSTFYGGGAEGYIDYPSLAEEGAA
ncbi:MAG: alkene reductase [Longimicrobiales bacterium]